MTHLSVSKIRFQMPFGNPISRRTILNKPKELQQQCSVSVMLSMEKLTLTHLLQNFKYQDLSEISTGVSLAYLVIYSSVISFHIQTALQNHVCRKYPVQFEMPVTVSSK